MIVLVVVMVLMIVLVVVMVLMIVLVVVVPAIFLHLRQQPVRQRHGLLHRVMDRPAAQLIPWRRDDGSIRILLTDQSDSLVNFLFRRILRPGEDDRAGTLNLIVIELAEVLHIHLCLLDVGNRNQRPNLQIAFLRCVLNRAADVRQLSNA